MPAINNPSISFSSSFEDIIRATLVEFALEIKRNETPTLLADCSQQDFI